PHFSPYTVGSVLDSIVGVIVPLLQSYLDQALSGPRTQTIPNVDLGVLALTDMSISFSGISGSAGAYNVTVNLSGHVKIDLAVGARVVSGHAQISGTYKVTNNTLDNGVVEVSLTDLDLSIADVLKTSASSLTVTQDGGDLKLHATAATGSLGVPNGPALTANG